MFLFFCFSCTRSMIIRNARNFSMNYFHSCKREVSVSQKISLFAVQADPAYFAFNFPQKFDSIIILVTPCNEATPIRQSSIWNWAKPLSTIPKGTNNFKCSIIQQKYLHIDVEFFEACSFTKKSKSEKELWRLMKFPWFWVINRFHVNDPEVFGGSWVRMLSHLRIAFDILIALSLWQTEKIPSFQRLHIFTFHLVGTPFDTKIGSV